MARRLSAAVVAEAVALRQQGLEFREIGQSVGHDYNTLREKVVAQLDPNLELVDVREEDLPLVAATGRVYWTVPVTAPTKLVPDMTPRQRARMPCSVCEIYEPCQEAVARGWAAGCEGPLAREFDARWVREGRGPALAVARTGGTDPEWPDENVDDETYALAPEAGITPCPWL